MTFLPIVDRELRVAARRKSTYRLRQGTTLVAIVLSAGFLTFAAVFQGGSRGVGNALFSVLSVYTFVLCSLAGVFATADCLSEEKREGTLGLLFLTDLKGYDVVLGKFAASSVNTFYGLLAIIPVIGLSLLMGGVTGAEFWRVTLALFNTLFVSLAAGICISARSRDAQRTMGAALGLLLLLMVLLPVLERTLSFAGAKSHWLAIAWVSPWIGFASATGYTYPGRAERFWGSLLASNVLGWVFLLGASLSLPRVWRDAEGAAKSKGRGVHWFGISRTAPGNQAPRRLLDINPVLWLLSAGRLWQRVIWALVGLWALFVGIVAAVAPGEAGWTVTLPLGILFAYGLKLIFAIHACRFFVEARRTGTLELLLATPLTSRQIIAGQWLAMKRLFLWPLIVFFTSAFAPMPIHLVRLLLLKNTPSGEEMIGPIMGGGFMVVYFLFLALDFMAIGWFGMWLALSMKRPALAPGATILFVVILPLFAACFWPLLFVADGVFIAWGWSKVTQDLRKLAAEQYQSPSSQSGSPSGSPAPVPPPARL